MKEFELYSKVRIFVYNTDTVVFKMQKTIRPVLGDTIRQHTYLLRQELLNKVPTEERVIKTIMRVNSYFGYFKNTSSYNLRKLYAIIILSSRFRPYIENHYSKHIRLKPQFKLLILKNKSV